MISPATRDACRQLSESLALAPAWSREWPLLASSVSSLSEYWECVRQSLPTGRGVDYWVVARAEEGAWQREFEHGTRQGLPVALLAEALDSGQPVQSGGWWGACVQYPEVPQAVLAVKGLGVIPGLQLKTLAQVASLLGAGWAVAGERQGQARQIQRLEGLLQLTREWYRIQETETLLHKLAETAAQWLEADRASLFFWDQPAKVLVGKPALGVPGGELRVPFDRGLVGQVLATGQPGRVDEAAGQEVIDRRVDQATGYVTRTLLAVPLFGADKKPFGVFEAINKRRGNFTAEDQAMLTELAAHAAIAWQNTRNREQLLSANRQVAEQAAADLQMIGNSSQMVALRDTVRRLAETELAVLILGENGTGKEVVSRLIHYHGPRRGQPFVAVNCAAIAETLIESELFGHEKGAFTDAHAARPGKFELANGGTLFLDEIGDLSPAGQAKLLRVLEDKVVVRVGGSTPLSTDVRVLAATNQDLAQRVRERKFREDLYYRLNVVTLELPPLRKRGEDVLLLSEHFLETYCRRAGRKPPQLSPTSRQQLLNHSWPGNVRELRNLMERVAYLQQEDTVELGDLLQFGRTSPAATTAGSVAPGLSLSRATDAFQVGYIESAVEAANHKMVEAAKRLGLHRSNLYRKMRQLGMQPLEE